MTHDYAARLTTLETGLADVRSDLADIKALLDPSAPARQVEPLTVTLGRQEKARDERVAARKAPKARKARKAPKKAAPKPTKGSQTIETLSRKDWNRTLTAKARLMGKVQGVSVYSIVVAHWAWIQENARKRGWTPDETLAYLTR